MKNRFLIILLVVLVLGNLFVAFGSAEETEQKSADLTDEYLIKSWRQEKLTLDNINNHYSKMYGHDESFKIRDDNSWKSFEEKIKDGDELWFFTSPPQTWEKLMGWEGYAIFRNDKLIAHYTTMEN